MTLDEAAALIKERTPTCKARDGAEAMDLIQAQRELSDKDLAIFNAELQRQSRSAILAYVLWFFLGGLGVHNFYMGKVL